jgi:deoxyhypusine synthase
MNMGKAIDIINEMMNYRLSDDAIEEDEDDEYKKPEVRKEKNELIFLSILQIRLYLCEYKMIDVIVIIYGGIEEVFIKCLAPFFILENLHLKEVILEKKVLILLEIY